MGAQLPAAAASAPARARARCHTGQRCCPGLHWRCCLSLHWRCCLNLHWRCCWLARRVLRQECCSRLCCCHRCRPAAGLWPPCQPHRPRAQGHAARKSAACCRAQRPALLGAPPRRASPGAACWTAAWRGGPAIPPGQPPAAPALRRTPQPCPVGALTSLKINSQVLQERTGKQRGVLFRTPETQTWRWRGRQVAGPALAGLQRGRAPERWLARPSCPHKCRGCVRCCNPAGGGRPRIESWAHPGCWGLKETREAALAEKGTHWQKSSAGSLCGTTCDIGRATYISAGPLAGPCKSICPAL